jgi:hypothetical protein
MRLSVIALAGLLALPVAAAGQTAAPASPRPDKKADKKAKDKKVFTNEDLETAGKDGKDGKGGAVTFLEAPPQPAEGAHAPSNAGSEEGRSSGSEEGRPASSEQNQTGESSWRERARETRGLVQTALGEVQKLEAKLDALRNPQQQPQPIEALQPDPQRRLTRDEERVQLEKDLEAARAALDEAQKTLDNFLEEARRNNVPPGWIEER